MTEEKVSAISSVEPIQTEVSRRAHGRHEVMTPSPSRPMPSSPFRPPDAEDLAEKQDVKSTPGSVVAVKRTPLPKLQMLCICLLRLGHPMTMKACYAWLPEALKNSSSIVTDDNLGSWVGIVEGIYTAWIAGALFFMIGLADRLGRKPVTLVAITGAVIAASLFGFASSLPSLVLLRSLAGIFMGSQAILRVILAETVDDTNQGEGFALFSLMWQSGALVAPVIGGLLSHPTRLSLFANVTLFETYPYLLACLVSVAASAFGVVLAVPFLKETKPEMAVDHTKYMQLSQDDDEDITPPPSPRPEGLRSLLRSEGIPEVLAAWTWLMISQATFESTSIVYASTSRDLGGLGMTTPEIGVALMVLSLCSTCATVILFPRLIRIYGPVRLTQLASWGTPLAYLVMPFWAPALRLAESDSRPWLLWLLMFVCLIFRLPATMAVQAAELHAARAAPQKSMTAMLNGTISILGNGSYAIGPIASCSLLSLSLSQTNSSLPAFALFTLIGCGCVWSTFRVKPSVPQAQREEEVVP